ncbi:hypothetical protein DXV76_18780 [Rhodobacteraceae bacterium CCMM004]|nr:hypothetical protein DXV76_18780 [Rhodobacteraceae bacterium CCMM004]
MDHRIAIKLFGPFEVRLDGVPVRMPTRKVELILALLAIDPGVALSRSTLAGLIWPGQPDPQARASLRQAIFRLKTALEASDALEVTSGWIRLRQDRVARDIDALRDGTAPEALPTGTPLEGLSGYEIEIEDRLDTARAELRARLLHWLEGAQARALGARRFADVETLARRHLLLDGYDEGALRMLMTALWRQGRRNAALDVFRDASQRIRADLSVSVDPATATLYHDIRAQPAAPKEPRDPRPAHARIAPDTVPADPPAEPALPHLKHLAVMHVVSDRLLAALRNRDPEDAEAASRAASDAIERVLRREGGVVAGRAGHRLSCVFGADRPSESPALSAALAAFEIARLDCAVGLDAARALVGGETANYPAAHLAQVLSEAAAPGEVRLTDTVAEACRGAFVLERQAPAGEDDVATWRLTGEVLSRGGFDIRKARGLTPLVGREPEVDALLSVATAAGSRAVAVTGEAGIGKSRLVHDCLTRLRPEHLLRVQFLANEIGGGIGRFAPVLESLLPADGAGDPRSALDAATPDAALRRRIAPAEAVLAARQPAGPETDVPRGMRLQAVADALLLATQVLAGRDTVLLVEDAQWADDDAALLLDRILRSLDPDCPMVIVTLRPGGALDLSGLPGLRTVGLDPLAEEDSIRLLTLLGREDPGDIAVRSGGVPLFLEEIARAGAALDLPGSLPIPEALTGLLSRRIDALPPHLRRMIEAATVLGAEPADDLLSPLSGLRPEAYEAAIAQLADGDLLFRIRSMPQRVYGFKHALVQEAAYHAIPTPRRKALHAQVVALREDDWRAGDKSLSAMLARHALASAQPAKAVELALCATEQAVARSSYPSAQVMLALALDAVRALEPTPKTRRVEAQILAWQRPLRPFAQTEGLSSNLERSREIATDLGDDRLLVDACLHLSYYASDNGQFCDARAYCDEGAAAAARLADETLLTETAMARARSYFAQTKFGAALTVLEDVGSFWDARRSERGEFAVTRYVFVRHLQACCHAGLGQTSAVLRHMRDLLSAARETGRPVDRFVACLSLGEVLCAGDRAADAAAAFQRAVEIAQTAELEHFVLWARTRDAEHAVTSGAQGDAAPALRRFLRDESGRLSLVFRLSAEAVLLCHAHRGETDLSELADLLARVREVDLPAVELRVLEALARDDPSPRHSWEAAAQAVRSAERYAPCTFSDAEATALSEATP